MRVALGWAVGILEAMSETQVVRNDGIQAMIEWCEEAEASGLRYFFFSRDNVATFKAALEAIQRRLDKLEDRG